MVIVNIEEIMSSLGWQDGFRIPVANEENKRLEDEIERKIKLKASLSSKLGSATDRIKMTKKRIEDVTAQLSINQDLLTAHAAQIQMEDHHYRLSCNIASSLRQDARNFEKEWKETNEVISRMEKDLAKVKDKIEEKKKVVKLDEENLQKFEEALYQNQEDNELIEKYMMEDAKEYKTLELKRQKLSVELETYRQAIITITDETHEMEVILDRTAKAYDEALKEHREMIDQWRDSVAVLRQRDNDIENILREIETLRVITREKKNALQEAEAFLLEQRNNNKKLDCSTKQLEKNLFALKEEYQKIKETIGAYETELRLQKNALKNLSQRTQQMRMDVKRSQARMQDKYAKIEELKMQIVELSAKLEDIDNQKLTVEEKTKELEKIVEEQEKRKKAVAKEMSRLQAANLRATSRIQKLESESKILQMQVQGECKQSEVLESLLTKETKNLEDRNETLYQVEFELQKSEMKLERLRGHERDKDETERKRKKIEELQATLNEKKDTFKLQQKHIATLEHNMKTVSNSIANDNNEIERLRNKKQELILLMNGGEKHLKAAQSRYEEKQVEESILRLKVSQMEKMLSNLGNNVYNLEKHALGLEAAIRERKAEIAVQKESLIVQKRIATAECSELRNGITERRTRIRQLQARYENCMASFGTTPDGTPLDTTYFKVQNAQERFLLQEQGDKLDETIRKTEDEIENMENTLRVINVCNDKYKSSLNADERELIDQEELRKLDEELCSAEKEFKLKENELHSLQENIQKMEDNYTDILKDIDKVKEEKEEKERYIADLERQINEQKDKILRADKNLRCAQRDIQKLYNSTGNSTLIMQEREVELREIQEQNALTLQHIAEFTIRHVEAEVYVKKLLATKNIELPSLFNLSPAISPCLSAGSTSRTGAFMSSRESIGSVIDMADQFDTLHVTNQSKRNVKISEASKKSTQSRQPCANRGNQQSSKKKS